MRSASSFAAASWLSSAAASALPPPARCHGPMHRPRRCAVRRRVLAGPCRGLLRRGVDLACKRVDSRRPRRAVGGRERWRDLRPVDTPAMPGFEPRPRSSLLRSRRRLTSASVRKTQRIARFQQVDVAADERLGIHAQDGQHALLHRHISGRTGALRNLPQRVVSIGDAIAVAGQSI